MRGCCAAIRRWASAASTRQRLPEVLATGVGSVAVVRALVADPQPEAAAARLMAAIDGASRVEKIYSIGVMQRGRPEAPKNHAII